MPGQGNEVVKVFDWPSEEAAQQKIIGALDQVEAKIKAISGVSLLSKNVSGVGEFKASSAEMQKAMEDLAAMQKKLIELENQLAAARYKTSQGGKAKTDEEIRSSVAARNEMKARTDAIKAEDDAYKQLALTYNKLAAEAKRLQAVALKTGLEEDKKAALEAAAAAKILSDQLKGIDRAVGDNRRNVGNYVDAIKLLEKEFNDLKARMDQMIKAGQGNTEQFREMAKQLGLLETLTSTAAKGFASVQQELKFVEKAMQTMRAAGLEGSEAFEQMRLQAASAREEFREFAEQQKMLAADSPILASLTVAAKGLAGAYAIGAGTAALFADGNEKVQKELNKLVAVMTLLQGLEQAHELLQKRGAIAVVFRAAAEKVKNFVLTGSTTGLKEKTAAEVINTEAEIANTEATEVNIVAQEAQTVAMEATTVATKATSAAMVTLRVALLATGIGALLLLLPLIAKAFTTFSDNAKQAAKDALELQEVIESLNETMLKQVQLEQLYLQGQREGLQQALSNADKAGKNYYELYAIRKRLAELDEQEAASLLIRDSRQGDVRNAVRKTTDEVEGLSAKIHGMEAVQTTMQETFIKNSGKMTEEQRKAAKEDLENYQKAIDLEQKKLDRKTKLLEDYNGKVAANEDLVTEREKFSADEQVAVTLAYTKAKAEARLAANQQIVNDERSTQAQILAAMDASLRQQLIIIEAERKAKLADTTLTPAGRQQVNIESNAARDAAIDTNNEAKRKKSEEFFKRYLAALNDVNKSALETESKTAEAIANNTKLSLDQRMAAYEEYATKQAALITADAEFQKKTAGLTSDELFAIEVKRQQRLHELYVAGQAKQLQIIQSSLDQQNKKLQGGAQLDSLKGDVKVLAELAQKFKEGKISIEQYQTARQALADKSSKDLLGANIITLEYLRGEYAKFGLDTMDIDRQIYENKKHLLELDLANEEKNQQRKRELKSKELELASAVENLAATLIEARFERELNAIQSQIDKNNEAKEVEIKNLETSTLSQQQRAAAVIEINAKTQTSNEELQRKQRDIRVKEAEFEKAKAALDIGVAGGEAIAKTLFTASVLAANPLTAAFAPQAYTLAAIEGGIMGAQIAAVLAKPIPKYMDGTDFHPGGLMYVHPGEIRVDPDGTVSKTPDAPETLTWGERGTRIISAEEARQAKLDSIFGFGGVMLDNANEQTIQEIQGLRQDIRKGNQELINAFAKQKPVQNHIHIEESFMVHLKNSV